MTNNQVEKLLITNTHSVLALLLNKHYQLTVYMVLSVITLCNILLIFISIYLSHTIPISLSISDRKRKVNFECNTLREKNSTYMWNVFYCKVISQKTFPARNPIKQEYLSCYEKLQILAKSPFHQKF